MRRNWTETRVVFPKYNERRQGRAMRGTMDGSVVGHGVELGFKSSSLREWKRTPGSTRVT